MPRKDGTGPVGAGPVTGKGLGPCTGAKLVGYGAGFGMGLGRRLLRRRGFGRGFAINQDPTKAQK